MGGSEAEEDDDEDDAWLEDEEVRCVRVTLLLKGLHCYYVIN
jgi:hypothetical protein